MTRDPTLYQKDSGYYYLIWYSSSEQRQKWTALGTKDQRRARRKRKRLLREGLRSFR